LSNPSNFQTTQLDFSIYCLGFNGLRRFQHLAKYFLYEIALIGTPMVTDCYDTQSRVKVPNCAVAMDA